MHTQTLTMSKGSQAFLRLIALVMAVAVTGCATKIRTIPNQALSKQSSTSVERDHRECEQGITGRLKGVWFPAELEFAACMIARNYQVYVQVLDAPVEVRRASLRGNVAAARILNDLLTCEQVVEEKVSMVEKIGRPVVAVAGVFFWPASVGSWAASATLFVSRQRDYTACMEPRGYVVTPWEPTPGELSSKPRSEERTSP